MNKFLRSTWLPVVCSLGLFVSLYAATPSFTSFDQTYFTTNNLRISFRSNGVPSIVVTNMTNVTLVTSNVYTTNLYTTNLYVSNIISSDLIWTNDTSFGGFGRITVKPEVTYEYLYPSNTIFAGWVSYVPQFKLMAMGSNNIPCNMYSSFLIIGADPDASLSQLYLQSGAVFGQDLILFSYTNTPFNGKFTLPADSAVVGGIGNVKLANGQDWVGENGAVLRLFWADPDWWEVGRWYAGGTNQPTTVTMNPTDGYLPVRSGPDTFGDSPWYTNSTDVLTDGRVGFGPGLTNWLYRDNSGIDLIYTNNNASQVRLGVASDTGLVYLGALSGFGGGLYANGGLQFNDGTSDLTFAFHQLYPNVDNDIDLGIDGRGWKSLAMSGPIYFTPGTTNLMYRSGSDFVLENDDASGFELLLKDTSGFSASYGVNGNGSPYVTSTRANYPVVITAGGANAGLYVNTTSLQPGTETVSIGTDASNGAWTNLWMKGTLNIQGTNDGAGNYSRASISHTGIGGEIRFNSLAAGTAGSPVPFVFTNASVYFSSAQQLGYAAYSQPPHGYFTNIYNTNLVTGNNDLFTVPSGKRFMLWQSSLVTTNATTTSFYHYVKTNGTYFRYSGPISVTTNVGSSSSSVLLFEPGEIVACNTDQDGVNAITTGVLFDYSSPLSSHRVTTIAATDNTLLTVSSGKTFHPYILTGGFVGSTQWSYYNGSGGPVVVKHYIVPSGGSVSQSTLVKTTTVSDGSSIAIVVPPLTAGSSLVLNSDSASANQMSVIIGGEF